MQVLVAESDDLSRQVTCELLRAWGYEVVAVKDYEAAWRCLQSEVPPRIALIEWTPKLDGVHLCHRLRLHQKSCYTYVIILTAQSAHENVVVALEAGADAFVTKPFDTNELRARIRAGQRIIDLQEQLVCQANRDCLTGVWNRGAIYNILQREIARARRTGHSLAVGMLDLDHFKRINDTCGHQEGDLLLANVAGVMLEELRAQDALGRYGGDEFLLVLSDSDESSAHAAIERVWQHTNQALVALCADKPLVTLSVGMVACKGVDCPAAGTLVRAADDLLYRAKSAGRNRVELAAYDQLLPIEATA